MSRKRPDISTLFNAIIGQCEVCLQKASFEEDFRRIESLVFVIRERIRVHWEEQHECELDRLVRKAKGGEDYG